MKEFEASNTQNNILKEYHLRKNIQVPEFKPQANKFILSDGRIVIFKDTNCLYKKSIFKGFHYANYLINYTDELPLSRDKSFRNQIIPFVNFINNKTINKFIDINLLKIFEAFRVESGLKPQSSGVMELRVNLRDTLTKDKFVENLDFSEIDYLTTLSETKLAPSDDSEQYTLTGWFSEHTWLRQDGVGVGADLYARFSSPKALMKSFNITAEISLLELQRSKYALIDFFKQCKGSLKGFVSIQQFDLTKGKNATDIALVIDAMDILYTKDVDTICLVSSDCDFTPLATITL